MPRVMVVACSCTVQGSPGERRIGMKQGCFQVFRWRLLGETGLSKPPKVGGLRPGFGLVLVLGLGLGVELG